MRDKFITPNDLKEFFIQGKMGGEYVGGNYISIGSIGDLLDICESYKKGKIKINREKLMERYDELMVNPNGPIKRGTLFIIDLEQDNLAEALFEKEGGLVHDLWSQAANKHISPRRSIRRLTIRITGGSTWWSENVVIQMEEYNALIG